MRTISQTRMRIKDIMESRGWPRYKMAKRLNINANTLHIFLLGGNMHTDTIEKIEDFIEEYERQQAKLDLEQ